MKKWLLYTLLSIPFVLALAVYAVGGQEPYLGLIRVEASDPTISPGFSGVPNELLMRTDSPGVYFKSGAANTDWTHVAGAGLAGAGLFSGVLTNPPRITSTGFTSWAFQPTGATFTETAQGVSIFSKYSGTQGARIFSARAKTADTPPYSYTVYISDDGYVASTDAPPTAAATMFGWYDGTKTQAIWITGTSNSGNPGGSTVSVIDSSLLNGGTATAVVTLSAPSLGVWERIRDDGTSVFFYISTDGDNFVPIYSVGKGVGYLANYNTVVFGEDSPYRDAYGEIMSYAQCFGSGC